MKIDYSLYLVTDAAMAAPQSIPEVINSLIPCGISCVQLRMKHASKKEIFLTGQALIDLLKPHGIPLIINDYIDIAKQLNADGIHLGQHDTGIATARKILGKTKIIGLSIENIAQARFFAGADVDYFGVGPIFPTNSKTDAAAAIGITNLRNITEILDKPIVAIGGIQYDNATAILQTGVDGLAIISAILAAADPPSACMTMYQHIQRIKNDR